MSACLSVYLSIYLFLLLLRPQQTLENQVVNWGTEIFVKTLVAKMEKEMATHSSILAWRIPGMGEPGGLPSMGRTKSDKTEAT